MGFPLDYAVLSFICG